MNGSIIARLYTMAERGISFVGEGKRFFDSIKKTFTLPYTNCRLKPIVSFLTAKRIRELGWHFQIRIKKSFLVYSNGRKCNVGGIPLEPGEALFLKLI